MNWPPTRESIEAFYMATPEGRKKLAQAIFQPARFRIEYAEARIQANEPHSPDCHDDHITLAERIFAASTEEEAEDRALIQLRAVLEDLKEQRRRLHLRA